MLFHIKVYRYVHYGRLDINGMVSNMRRYGKSHMTQVLDLDDVDDDHFIRIYIYVR